MYPTMFHVYHKEIKSITFVILFLIGVCYDLKCPVRSQHQQRLNNSCDIFDEDYMCLKDVFTFQHIELCTTKRHFQRPGYMIVWSGNFNGQICDSQRYQPIRYFNSDGIDCILRKSVCNEEGQIIVEDGSPISDRRCRCDYRRGYSFVSEPKNKCSCIPSIEDCSCYFKHCPKYHELSPDYKCIWQDEVDGRFSCQKLLGWEIDNQEKKMENSRQHIHVNSADKKLLTYEMLYAEPKYTLHILCTMICLVILNGMEVIGFCILTQKTQFRWKNPFSEIDVLAEESTCKYTKSGQTSTLNTLDKRNIIVYNLNKSKTLRHVVKKNDQCDYTENINRYCCQLKQFVEPNMQERDVHTLTLVFSVPCVDSNRQTPHNEFVEKFEQLCREYGYQLIKQLSNYRTD